MKERNKYLLIATIAVFTGFLRTGDKKELLLYKDANAPIEQRVNDLLSRMTLEEKVGQMCQFVGSEHRYLTEIKKNKNSDIQTQSYYKGLSLSDIDSMIVRGEIGSFLHVKTAQETNFLQSLAMKSRLQIPLIFGIDAIHGTGLTSGATVYPSPITIASSWDTSLARDIASQTAEELRSLGLHWTFTPNVDVARDARWGRVGETFGEDPFLVSEFGTTTIKGFQNNGKAKLLACAKHFIAGSEPENGLNASPMDLSERKLREIFLPPYEAAVKAGVATVMAAHNELNGVPCHSNEWLLQKILRDELGFNGFIVSDWMDIEALYKQHHVARSLEEADLLAIDAGIDMHMHGPGFYERVIKLVRSGKLDEERINRAVRGILRAKFELGLFKNPFVDTSEISKILFNEKHRETALKAAREGIVLLKNDGILPIDENKYDKILITGPNANTPTILGDWVLSQPKENVTTILEGFRKEIKDKNKLAYFDCGTSVKHIDKEKIKQATELARKSDLVILVLGENPLRYMAGEKTSGENVARSNIKLPGNQLDLVKAVYATGKPVVVILVNGRPLGIEWIVEKIPAIVETFEPGEFGGEAVAEIAFGKVNPSGKLPITFPRNVGQIVTTYNHKPSSFVQRYVETPRSPLFPFGYGLNYTKFSYSNLKTDKKILNKNEKCKVSVKVKNTGKREGDEIVQLYIRDEFSSVTRPVKELKDFKRVHLKPGESKTVNFIITPEKLAFYNLEMKRVVEPGKFTIMVGSSSLDKDLLKTEIEVQ